MYETESNSKLERSGSLPPEVLARYSETAANVTSRTLLPWGEHCTECAWPACYSTCEFYYARPDGKCRRFAEGMVRVECPEALNTYLLKIRFRRWAKLWAPGNICLSSLASAHKRERNDHVLGSFLYRLPLPRALRNRLTTARYSHKKRQASRLAPSLETPTCFLLECFNPGQPVSLSLTMRSEDKGAIPFEHLINVTPGFHRVRIPFADIASVLDVRRPFHVDVVPNDLMEEAELCFGAMDFVRERTVLTEPDKKPAAIKCVVWDLDNTLWDGILVEDGIDHLRLKRGVAEVIAELDRRGILHSIASKNNPDEALEALRRFGLHEFFLSPQISWQPKSAGIQTICSRLNIGIDTLLFIDDSKFELEEVTITCPGIRVVPADQYLQLPDLKICQVPVTAESQTRRQMYRVENERQSLAESFGQDYNAFLRHCQIHLTVRPLAEENLERVHELTQRTNQMNFSGNRYDKDLLRTIMGNPSFDTYVLACDDRFGSYGIVGFCLVDNREPRMTDLMFSCRVQSKRVEHAFLAFLIQKYLAQSKNDFYANYRKTPRNAPSGKVFSDLGMEEIESKGGVSSMVFRKGWPLTQDRIVEITVEHERGAIVES